MLRIAIASDHAGYEYKEILKKHLASKGIEVDDYGTNSEERVDYPEFIRGATKSILAGKNNQGIILGGSGNEAIVANRFRGIRCAVVWNTDTARLSKEHGNCNMVAIGQRQMSSEEAIAIVDTWLAAEFKGGRHQRRINQIDGE